MFAREAKGNSLEQKIAFLAIEHSVEGPESKNVFIDSSLEEIAFRAVRKEIAARNQNVLSFLIRPMLLSERIFTYIASPNKEFINDRFPDQIFDKSKNCSDLTDENVKEAAIRVVCMLIRKTPKFERLHYAFIGTPKGANLKVLIHDDYVAAFGGESIANIFNEAFNRHFENYGKVTDEISDDVKVSHDFSKSPNYILQSPWTFELRNDRDPLSSPFDPSSYYLVDKSNERYRIDDLYFLNKAVYRDYPPEFTESQLKLAHIVTDDRTTFEEKLAAITGSCIKFQDIGSSPIIDKFGDTIEGEMILDRCADYFDFIPDDDDGVVVSEEQAKYVLIFMQFLASSIVQILHRINKYGNIEIRTENPEDLKYAEKIITVGEEDESQQKYACGYDRDDNVTPWKFYYINKENKLVPHEMSDRLDNMRPRY